MKRREARWLHSFIRRHQRRWVDKGADSPLAVLTTVLARRVWKRQTLARYLGVEEGECDRLLNVLGYEASSARGVYRRSGDRKKSALSEELVASIFEGFDPLLEQEAVDMWERKRPDEESQGDLG